jgi:hypothetical protein
MWAKFVNTPINRLAVGLQTLMARTAHFCWRERLRMACHVFWCAVLLSRKHGSIL